MPNRLPDHIRRMLAYAYRDGMTMNGIEAKYGYSRSAVRFACKMLGVPLRKRGATPVDDPNRFAAIRAAIEGGMSQREARRMFNASDGVILRAMGLPDTHNARRREIYHAAKEKRGGVNQALADEVEAAMIRDRARLAECEERRRMRLAA